MIGLQRADPAAMHQPVHQSRMFKFIAFDNLDFVFNQKYRIAASPAGQTARIQNQIWTAGH